MSPTCVDCVHYRSGIRTRHNPAGVMLAYCVAPFPAWVRSGSNVIYEPHYSADCACYRAAPRDERDLDKRKETIASKARFLRDLLANDTAGERLRLTATQARSECCANALDWAEIQRAAELLGVRWDRSGPKGQRMLFVPRDETPQRDLDKEPWA